MRFSLDSAGSINYYPLSTMQGTATDGKAELGRQSLPDRVAKILRDEILLGQLALGERLPEVQFARRFNVSHVVIREAFHILQGEHLVRVDPYRGRSVFEMSKEQAEDLTLMRAGQEALAAALAAQRLTVQSAERIEAAARHLRQRLPQSPQEWLLAHLEIHAAVWAAAQNPWLARELRRVFLPLISIHILRYRYPHLDPQAVYTEGFAHEVDGDNSGHQDLSNAILRGDPQRARIAMISHVLPGDYWASRRLMMYGVC